jgi:hypothetical protein
MSKKSLNISSSCPADGLPTAKRALYMQAMAQGRYHEVAQGILEILGHFNETPYTSFGGSDLARIDEFVLITFMVMTDPKFKPTKQDSTVLVSLSHVFAHLVATSSYETTTPVLMQIYRGGGDNFERSLFMNNVNVHLPISQTPFFDIDPYLASVWFNAYTQTNSDTTPVKQKNLLNHYANMDERWVPPYSDVSCPYFGVSYFAQSCTRKVKGIMNAAIKERLVAEIKNNPDPKSVAIISAKWHRNHAVYKSNAPLVDQLKGHYKTTLVHIGNDRPPNLVTEGFDKVCDAFFRGDKLVLPPEVMNNDFQFVFFPDIGMNAESIWLANARMAPIQAMGYGHPDTAGDGSNIDYFIGGEVEKDCQDSYSEQLVLLPGLATVPAWPTYERKHNWVNETPVKINCIWGPDKHNTCMLQGLAQISKLATVEHEWHFYPSPAINRYACFVPFKKEIMRLLPNAVFHGDLHYMDYMESAEKGDFTVNSFPFGGFNTVVESLFLGLPVVSLEGSRFYNIAGPHLIRQVGMPELATTDPNKFVKECVDMINDSDVRQHYREELAELDLKKLLFEDVGDYFKRAVDYLIANHPIDRVDPILVGELNAEA